MIEDSIRAQALAFTELTDIIDQNFHLNIGHSSINNYVLLRVISDDTPVELHMEHNQSEANIQLDCFSKSPQTAQSISEKINACFNGKGFSDNDLTVQLAVKQNRIPAFDTDTKLHQISLDYIFKYNPKTN